MLARRRTRCESALSAELGNDVSIDSSAEPSAVIMIGGVEPMRTVRDGVPVSTVSLSETPAPDIRIVAAPDPSPVPVGWAATFTATVEGRGLAGKTSRLVLEDRGAELAHLDLKWTSDSERIQGSLRYTPPAAGTSVVTIRAVPADGETVATDNAADVRLVATGRQLKVLVHEPRPSWNAIFVRRALEEDPTFNVSSRAQASRGLEVSAGNAPAALTAEALSGFDVVVVGAPEDLRASEVEALRSFARRRGGGVVLLPDKRPTGSYLGLLPAPQFDEVLVDSAVELSAPGQARVLRFAHPNWLCSARSEPPATCFSQWSRASQRGPSSSSIPWAQVVSSFQGRWMRGAIVRRLTMALAGSGGRELLKRHSRRRRGSKCRSFLECQSRATMSS